MGGGVVEEYMGLMGIEEEYEEMKVMVVEEIERNGYS